MILRSLTLAALLALVPLGLGAHVLRANAAPPPPPPALSLDQAIAIALHAVPGTLREAELDRERGTWVYEVELATTTGEVDVEIDGDRGVVLAIERDDDD